MLANINYWESLVWVSGQADIITNEWKWLLPLFPNNIISHCGSFMSTATAVPPSQGQVFCRQSHCDLHKLTRPSQAGLTSICSYLGLVPIWLLFTYLFICYLFIYLFCCDSQTKTRAPVRSLVCFTRVEEQASCCMHSSSFGQSLVPRLACVVWVRDYRFACIPNRVPSDFDLVTVTPHSTAKRRFSSVGQTQQWINIYTSQTTYQRIKKCFRWALWSFKTY